MEESKQYTWDKHTIPQPKDSQTEEGHQTFQIRHLRAGRTGARKTWASAPVLLNYLTLKDGLQHLDDDNNIDDASELDMTLMTNDTLAPSNKAYNILELGGGSGFLSVGLAKTLPTSPTSPHDTKIMCTDADRNTIKNMRHNVCENKETKTISVEKLDWGGDVGGVKFANALERKFRDKSLNGQVMQCSDPIQLLTHVIGSDVHYGETTLNPLSSIISAIKLRNPDVHVIIMQKERSPKAVSDLVEQIKVKVEERNCGQGFSIRVRDVVLGE